MIKKFLISLFLFILISMTFSEELSLDDVSSDGKGNYSIKIHNLNDSQINNLKLTLDGKEYTDFKIEKINSNYIYGVIIDNSGSMKLKDFFKLLERMKYILDNIKEDDYLIIWKLNDSRIPVYSFAHPDKSFSVQIGKLIREGTYTRLYDAIIQSKKDLNDLINKEEFKSFYPYLVVLSDADDIKSESKPDDILVDNNNIPFYFFSYLTLPDKKITLPYEKLSETTKGKFLERPDEVTIKKYLFDRNNRYLLSLKINKKDFKKDIIIAEIKNGDENSLTVELKNYDQKNNNSNLNNNNNNQNNINNFKIPEFKLPLKILLFLLLIIGTLLILLLIFLLFRKKFMNVKFKAEKRIKENKSTFNKSVFNNHSDNFNDSKGITTGENKSTGITGNKVSNKINLEDKTESEFVKDKEKIDDLEIANKSQTINEDKTPEITAPRFMINQKIVYRETKDLLTSKKYNKINLFHNEQTTFVDEAETRGQEVYYSTLFALKKLTADYLICTGKMFLLLDEILKLNKIPFRVIGISIDKRKKMLNYKIVPLEKIDLLKIFAKQKELDISKKAHIYGTSDSIMERMITRKSENPLVFYGEWKNAEIINTSEKTLRIITGNPVILDTYVEFKTNISSLRKINARIVAAEIINDKDYLFTLELME